MAMEGFHAAATEEEAIKMCTLAFKCAIQLDDYNEAYDYVMKVSTFSAAKILEDNTTL